MTANEMKLLAENEQNVVCMDWNFCNLFRIFYKIFFFRKLYDLIVFFQKYLWVIVFLYIRNWIIQYYWHAKVMRIIFGYFSTMKICINVIFMKFYFVLFIVKRFPMKSFLYSILLVFSQILLYFSSNWSFLIKKKMHLISLKPVR